MSPEPKLAIVPTKKALYGEDYFERGEELNISSYTNYRWLPDLTRNMVRSMMAYLPIRPTEIALDFGTAKGFIPKALRLEGIQAYGVDISEYAISCAPEDVRPFLACGSLPPPSFPKRFDWTISKDVFEHIAYTEIIDVLEEIRDITQGLFAVVPLGDGRRYFVPEYEKDVTHVIREDLTWWKEAFVQAGFKVDRATYRVPGVKDNWAHYPEGNGFFVLR